MKNRIGTIIVLLCIQLALHGQGKYECKDGSVYFTSDAPLELIKARSDKLKGVIDLESKTFAFKLRLNDFQGFNSPLQRVHFMESYMEVDRYPESTFVGKFISDPQDSLVRIKGDLEIHGVHQELIIEVEMSHRSNGTIQAKTNFTVLLEEYDINVPRMVYQKIAQEILVEVNATFKPQNTGTE